MRLRNFREATKMEYTFRGECKFSEANVHLVPVSLRELLATPSIITEIVYIAKTFCFFTNIIVPTFDTKVTEYLCSGWVFFLSSDKFRLFNWPFLTEFFYIIRKPLLS